MSSSAAAAATTTNGEIRTHTHKQTIYIIEHAKHIFNLSLGVVYSWAVLHAMYAVSVQGDTVSPARFRRSYVERMRHRVRNTSFVYFEPRKTRERTHSQAYTQAQRQEHMKNGSHERTEKQIRNRKITKICCEPESTRCQSFY